MNQYQKLKARFREKYIGTSWTMNNGSVLVINDYIDSANVTVRFVETGNVYISCISNITRGLVRDKRDYLISHKICNVGYIGVGKYTKNKDNQAYRLWLSMLRRCGYDKHYQQCSVSESWYNFQNFAKWFYENKFCDSPTIDKDILCRKNKVYSPDTCCLIPIILNTSFSKDVRKNDGLPKGVYKTCGNRIHPYYATLAKDNGKCFLGCFHTVEDAFRAFKLAKEKRLKDLADQFKHDISPKVYKALLNYKVEITD